jgi:predicted AlkP superfamily phosphohydrolase/phosphomutase
MLYSSGTAFAQHYYWSDMESGDKEICAVAARTFAASDRLIGRIARTLDDDDDLVVMSECGAGPLAGGVDLNLWLEQNGLLARSSGDASALARLLTAGRAAAPKVLPRSAFHLANRLPIKAWVQGRIATDGLDWTRTRAFHRGKGEGNIYVNLKGRDLHGVVEPADYEAVREEIIGKLIELVDPATGARAVAGVHRREELFVGPHLERAPDLVVEWAGFKYMPAEARGAGHGVFGPRVREYMTWPTTGSHRREGFLMIRRKGAAPGVLEEPADLRDLAPTWLEMLGAPAPAAMEGRSILSRLSAARTPAPV